MRSETVLLLTALLLAAARVTTGIVYEADAPIAALVVKSRPAFASERTATAAMPAGRDIVLDREEPQLVYASLYLAIMRSVPWLAAAGLGAAAWLRYRRARR